MGKYNRKSDPWVSVKDRLPEPECEVLVVCNRFGHEFVCPAIYEDGQISEDESVWHWSELYGYGTYDEDNDCYLVPEGWWENRSFTPDDTYNTPIDCEVTHWMPLPEVPGTETTKG